MLLLGDRVSVRSWLVSAADDGPVRMIGARINANNSMRTTEQLVEQKKEMHISSFQLCLDELSRHLTFKEEAFERRFKKDSSNISSRARAFKSFTSSIVEEAREFFTKQQRMTAAETYRALVEEMLTVKRMAQSKMEFYLVDYSIYYDDLKDWKIRDAHRYLMAYYKKQICCDETDADMKSSLAVTVCKAEGLIRASVHEENELGEPVIIQGSADGWDHDKLWLLIQAGAEVNASCGPDKSTALIEAAQLGRASTVKALAGLQADVNHADNYGSTALRHAAAGGHAETVRLLAELQADVNHAENTGHTAVKLAAQGGHGETVRVLAELQADVNHAANTGHTAVMIAADGGHGETVRLLAELQADVNHAGNDGVTAVMLAA